MKTLLDAKNRKKRHILFLISSLLYGGSERVVVNLSNYFAESERYRVSIMLLEDGICYNLPAKINVFCLHRRQRPPFNRIASLISDPFRLKRFVKENDVDIVLSFMQRPNIINMLSKALGSRHASYANVRCSLRAHYRATLNLFNRALGWAIFKWLWRYADGIIVNSKVIKDEIIDLFNIAPENVEVIYNPINLKEIEAQSKEPVKEDWFSQDIPVIINVGSLTKPKGHRYLLKAFSLLAARRPARLAIIGDGELKNALLDEAKRLGIADRVRFMGWQKNPFKYIARSKLFVLSSLYEGFPNVILEALACGCPVVTFDCVSGPSEILLPGEDDKSDIVRAQYGILVRRKDEKALSKAIEELLDDKTARENYAKAGLERAKAFDVSVIAKRYQEVFYE